MTTSWDSSDIIRGLLQATAKIKVGAAKGLGDWGEFILSEAVRIVPLEEGTLQNSGVVAQSIDGMRVAIGFGSGAAAPYAIVQHERLDFYHKNGRQAKYLERPFMASRQQGMILIQRAIRRL